MLLPSHSYDLFEINKNYYQWLASSTKAFWTNPVFGFLPTPILGYLRHGESYRALIIESMKPDWNITSYF